MKGGSDLRGLHPESGKPGSLHGIDEFGSGLLGIIALLDIIPGRKKYLHLSGS